MSKFFQNSLKKEKNLNIIRTNNDTIPIISKKKTTKKFMISPVKDTKNEILKNEQVKKEKQYNSHHSLDHIFNNIQNNINRNEKGSKIYSPDISYMYKKCGSPLCTSNDLNKEINNSNTCLNTSLPSNLSSLKGSSTLISSSLYDYDNDNIIDNLKEHQIDKNSEKINYDFNNNENKKENKKETQNRTMIDCSSINKLNSLSLNKEPNTTYIQKEKVTLYDYNIMFDINSETFLNICKDIPCFYCRRKFESAPIGVPIKYYPSVYILINNSQLSKYSFNYKENVVKLNKNERKRLIDILQNNENNICNFKQNEKNNEKNLHKVLTKNFFETEGTFCSFNCIVSFIEENSSNPIYQNSNNLIYLMYKQIFGWYPEQSFIRSPSWKLRKEYGGPLSDEDYDKYIQTIPIIDTKQVKNTFSYSSEFTYEVLV